MRSIRTLIFFCALLLAVGPLFAADQATPEAAKQVVATYHDVPKGVVLEGTATGFEEIATIAYDKEKNTFTINGKATYANPVSRKEMQKIFKALKKDDRLGVTLIEGELRTYGDLSKDSDMARDLAESDRFLGGVIYGIERLLGDVKLPGNYTPKKAEDRKIPVVAFSSFTEYAFEKKGDVYQRSGLSLSIMLIPLSDKKTPSGGHLPDEDAMKSYAIHPADKANLDHLKSYQAEYFKMPQFAKSVVWGEAAAFARLIRDSGKIDGDEFLKMLK